MKISGKKNNKIRIITLGSLCPHKYSALKIMMYKNILGFYNE